MIKKYDWIRIIQFSSILSRELEYIEQYTFNLKLVCEKREFYFIFFCQSFVKIQSKLIYFNLWFISHICILFSPQITCSIFHNTIRFFPMPPLLSTKMLSQKRKSWKVCYKLTEKNIKLPCTVCGDFYLFFLLGDCTWPMAAVCPPLPSALSKFSCCSHKLPISKKIYLQDHFPTPCTLCLTED